MGSLFHFLLTYWPILLILYLPRLAQLVAVIISTRTRDRLDREIPDELPLTAGEWLAQRVAALGLPVTTLVTNKESDGYRPLDKLIQLHDHTHFKADPVYWATAAHELGHARLRAEAPIVGHLRSLGQFLLVPLLAAGIALLAAYVLYAYPLAGTLSFACFAAAAGTRVFTLVDEALASVIAYRELRANDAIDFVHLRAIRAVLVTAFATYFVTYASYAALLAWWPALDALVVPATPMALTSAGVGVAVVLTIGCVAAAVLALVEMFAPDELGELYDDHRRLALLAVILRWVPIVALIWMIWDVRVDPLYVWCVIAALAASWRAWLRMVHVPLVIPWYLVALFVDRFRGPGVDKTSRFVKARLLGRAAVLDGNRRLEALAKWWRDNPPISARITLLARLGYLPLLVAFWLGL